MCMYVLGVFFYVYPSTIHVDEKEIYLGILTSVYGYSGMEVFRF